MPNFTDDVRIDVVSFSRQVEGEEAVIGNKETGTFLAIPVEGVEVLDDLAGGRTVGEVRNLYLQRHGETPDLEDFLSLLEAKGFVHAAGTARPVGRPGEQRGVPKKTLRPHFENISQETARRIFSPGVVRAACLYIALGMTAAALEPRILPGRYAFYFARHQALSALGLFVLSYLAVFVHEMGHLIAARAVGVGSRMTISHRLWVLVAETDLTGLWSVPKRDRYLPMLAGPLVDAVSASTLLLLLFARNRGWIALPDTPAHFLAALLFLYFMRILWQCFFFVRTDFYYVIASFFNCRNLLGDTETFLRNQLARLGWVKPVGVHHIPPAEAAVIRAYAPVWLAGRLLAFGVLFYVTLPVAYRYLKSIAATVGAGYSGQTYQFVDSVSMALFTLIPLGAGLTLWLRSLARDWSTRRDRQARVA
jgi:hypothetical protein